jgi:cation diffusion facilitator family transporter
MTTQAIPATLSTSPNGVPAREKASVALASLLTAALLTGLKLVVGFATGSLGILSEGAHSALDFVAALVTYVSVRVADRPADYSHPFGHGKVEHLSALVETGLLLATCAWIVIEAVRRLFFLKMHVEPSVWAYAVLLISIGLDTFRSRALFRVARKYDSQALEADALHFSMDVYSSSAVILGLVLVSLARPGHWPWLERADPVAALVVAGITVYIGLRLGKRNVDALVDAAPEGTAARIAASVAAVPGVLDQDRIRVRKSGRQLFVDLRVTVDSNIPLEHAQTVVESVEAKVREVFPAADVVVRAAPRPPRELVEHIRAVASRRNNQVHDVTAYEVRGRVKVSLDLEVNPELSLDAAHREATELESALVSELPEIEEVNVHIEPRLNRVEAADQARSVLPEMESKLMQIARDTPGLLDCHSLEADRVGANVFVTLHCTLEPELPVARVHDITEELKFRFRQEFPQIFKVSIHAEPRGTAAEPAVRPLGERGDP